MKTIHPNRPSLFVLPVLVLALGLASCGGDDATSLTIELCHKQFDNNCGTDTLIHSGQAPDRASCSVWAEKHIPPLNEACQRETETLLTCMLNREQICGGAGGDCKDEFDAWDAAGCLAAVN